MLMTLGAVAFGMLACVGVMAGCLGHAEGWNVFAICLLGLQSCIASEQAEARANKIEWYLHNRAERFRPTSLPQPKNGRPLVEKSESV